MADNKNDSGGLGSLKNLLFGAAVLVPVGVGLGLAYSKGFGAMGANKAQLNPSTGPTANPDNMIGRRVGVRTQELVKNSLARNKENLSKSTVSTVEDFVSIARTGGPQRAAVVAAFQEMLKSPFLNLPETTRSNIVSRMNIAAAGSPDDIGTFMRQHINQAAMGFGTRREEFFSEFKGALGRHGALQSSLTATPGFAHKISNGLKMDRLPDVEIMRKRSSAAAKSYDAFAKLFSEAGMGSQFKGAKIFEVSHGKFGTGYMARISSNGAMFDVPLLLARGGTNQMREMLGNAPGGIAYKPGKTTATPVGIGTGAIGSLSSLNVEQGEDYAFRLFKEQIMPKLRNANALNAGILQDTWNELYFGQGQMARTVGSPVLDQQLAKFAWRVTPEGFDAGNREHVTALRSNNKFSELDVSQDRLALNTVMLKGGPTTQAGFLAYSEGDLTAGAKIQQVDKSVGYVPHAPTKLKSGVIKSNNGINAKLNWTDGSQVGMDLTQAQVQLQGGSRFSRFVIFEDENHARGYTKDLGIYDGGYLGKTNNLEIDGVTKSVHLNMNGKATPLGAHIMANADKAGIVEQNMFIDIKQLRAFSRYEETVDGVTKKRRSSLAYLGMDDSGKPVGLEVNRRVAGIKITGIQPVAGGGHNIIYKTEYKASKRMKVHSHSLKGTMFDMTGSFLANRAKDAETGIGAHAYGRFTSAGLSSENIMYATSKRYGKDRLAQKHQLLTAGTHALSVFGMDGDEAHKAVMGIIKNDKAGTKDMAASLAQLMQKHGVSDDVNRFVVAGAYQFGKTSEKSAAKWEDASSKILAGMHGGHDALLNSRFVGVETGGIARPTEIQGGGKIGAIERRTITGFLEQFKSAGLSVDEQVNLLHDITSRTLSSDSPHKFMAAHGMHAFSKEYAGLNGLADYKGMSKNVGNEYTEVTKGLKEVADGDFLNSLEYKNAHGMKLDLHTPEARDASMRIFGTEQPTLPGGAISGGLEGMTVKRGGDVKGVSSEYMKSLRTMLNTAANPGAGVDEIAQSMDLLKRQIGSIGAELVGKQYSDKIIGSSTFALNTLNKTAVNESRYRKLMKIAKEEKFQSVFVTDAGFMNGHVSSMRKHFGADLEFNKELIEQTKHHMKQYFWDGSVDTFALRNPTLGIGHGGAARMRRLGGRAENQRLVHADGVKQFLRKELPGMEGGYTLPKKIGTKDLKHFIDKADDGAKNRFIDMLFKKSSNFMGSTGGSAEAFVPVANGTMKIDGAEMPVQVSRMNQMYGDVDGDTVTMIMTARKDSQASMAKLLRGEDPAYAKLFAQNEGEFLGMLHIAKARGSSLAGESTADAALEAQLNQVYGKKIGGFSNSLDSFRISMLEAGGDKEMNRKSLGALAVLEEYLLKSKKRDVAVNIADQFSQAMKANDYDWARDIISDNVFERGKSHAIELDIPDFAGMNQKTTFNFDELWSYMTAAREQVKKSGGLSFTSTKALSRRFLESENGYSDPSLRRMLSTMASGEHGFFAGAIGEAGGVVNGESIQMLNEVAGRATGMSEKLTGLLGNKRFLAGAAVAAGVGLFALNMSAPGYSPKPLSGPGETLSPQVQDATMSGSIMTDTRNALSSALGGQRDFDNPPVVNPSTMMDNETMLTPNGNPGRVEATINGIGQLPGARHVISSMGLTKNHMYIQDSRRPITKNYLDRFNED
jgi:hypothetical protein